jgi:GMP synthase (glutamine-hydrolysing)
MSIQKPIVIVKMGTTEGVSKLASLGDFDKWIISGTKANRDSFLTVSPFNGESLPKPEDISGIIITGSATMITEKHEWIDITAEWLRGCFLKEIPTLGICFGHHLIAYAMNGEVDWRPICREIGTVDIYLKTEAQDNSLFANIPNKIKAHAVHSQSISKLPEGAVILADNDWEPYHAFSLNNHIWGIQFHPEFDENIIKTIIDYYHSELEDEGIDINNLTEKICSADYGTVILSNFFNIVKSTSLT